MFVRDISQEERTRATGICVGERLYQIMSDAQELLSDKGLVDANVGEISICVCNNFVTLPPEVSQILGMQVDSQPAIIRNQWFQFHINAPGDTGWTPCNYADILGTEFCTIREPDRPVRLVLNVRSAQDANKRFMVFGWDADGNRIHTPDSTGQMKDGFYVPTVFGALSPAADVPAIVKIERISKDPTIDFLDLHGVDPDTNEVITALGSYRPDEVTPRYTRVRVSAKNVVRIKFRRADTKITGEGDWINTDHKQAFLLACKAIEKRSAEQFDAARWCEAEAARLLKERQRSRRPAGIAPPQITVSATNFGSGGLHYR